MQNAGMLLCFGESCWENPYSEHGIQVQNATGTAILERFSQAAWQHFGELSTSIKQSFLLKGREGSCRKTRQPCIHPWLHKCHSQEGLITCQATWKERARTLWSHAGFNGHFGEGCRASSVCISLTWRGQREFRGIV